MASDAKHQKLPPRPDLYGQKLGMTIHQPGFQSRIAKDRKGPILVCNGAVQPTPASEIYKTRIEYRMMYRPRVYILSPELRPREQDKRIPHTFGPNRPCLYFDEWNTRMLIATSIVPWLMLWLLFYESWRFTGIWQGSGYEEENPVEDDTRERGLEDAA